MSQIQVRNSSLDQESIIISGDSSESDAPTSNSSDNFKHISCKSEVSLEKKNILNDPIVNSNSVYSFKTIKFSKKFSCPFKKSFDHSKKPNISNFPVNKGYLFK